MTDICKNDLSGYRKFDSINGFQITVSPQGKYIKTDSSVIRYYDELDGKNCFGKVMLFLLFNYHCYTAIHCLRKIDNRHLHGKIIDNFDTTINTEVEELFQKYDNRNIITPYELVEPQFGQIAIVPVKNIRDICVLMDSLKDFWVVSSFPNSVEPN